MQPVSQTEVAYDWIKAELLDGRLMPGAKLKIAELQARADVSVAAIREALSRLTTEGLVHAIPQRGFVVAPISKADLKDLTAVRIEIETKCLRKSIEAGDIAWQGQLKAIWHQLENTPHFVSPESETLNPAWTALHSDFHDALISACGSVWWLKLRDQLYAQAERYRRLLLPYAKTARNPDAEHKAIVEATLARDADFACSLLEAHLRQTADLLLASDAPFEDVAGAATRLKTERPLTRA
ncbi:GntR family transcriptional regulator [Rhizobium sp. L1K21]|uniref:GntR family transcriptional regulator n=1 Tax=Rhizobium sp. L1K21 TaxID=2954933 RepID=UPI00209233AE|nr:GntR family transcriptional regulator [Rhizobium sp. L1K21]MCO6188412.1 GntR family transcriptional regulator [Rhizobium sp. L1K21]